MNKPTTRSLLGDVIAIAHKSAIDQGYVDDGAVDFLKDMEKEALLRASYSAAGTKDRPELVEKKFKDIQQAIMKKDDMAVNHVSRLTALDALLVNAVGSAARARNTDSAQELAAAYLQDVFKGKQSTEEKNAVVEALKEGLDHIVISLTHTMHPTIYHTPEARRFEAGMTRLLEDRQYVIQSAGELQFTEEGKGKAQVLMDAFIGQLAKEEAQITPKKPVTVGEETVTEKENFNVLRQETEAVINGWNAAVAEAGLSPEQVAGLTLSDAQKQKLFELRSWGQSADADGREKATSQFLYASVQNNMKDGHYKGPILDLRQNAAVHRDFISSLIQVKFRNSNHVRQNDSNKDAGRYHESAEGPNSFQQFCKDFMNGEREKKYEALKQNGNGNGNGNGHADNMGWDGAEQSIFQQLDADDRAHFISAMIRKDFPLIPEQLKKDTLEFNRTIYPVREQFLKTHAEHIRNAGLDPETIDYNEMIRVSVPHEGTQVSLRPLWDAQVESKGWIMPQGELQYRRLSRNAYPTAEELQVKNLLQGTRKMVKTDKGWEQSELEPVERATFTDTAKRMVVINDAIDKAKARGDTVATRYQIANFSEAADFLIAIKLFADAGLAQVEKGQVKSTKLGIMPLLETEEDLKKAPKLFESLLENDIASSFWKERGKAEIMLGFSDGAASAGNFASQWAIYKASRELTELFASKGIKVEFFQGRGRGMDRGGTVDPALQMQLMPPEVTCRGRYDVTIQSDLPMDMAASKRYGEHYLARTFTSVLDSYVKGKESRDYLKQLEEGKSVRPREAREKTLDAIADESAKVYVDMVRNNPDALAFFNNAPDNGFRSSRSTARGGITVFKDFDKVRAIPKEYLFGGADLQAHNVGPRTALQHFVRSHGKTAEKELSEMFTHPFAEAVTQTIRAGLTGFDPSIARAHAHAYDVHAQHYKQKEGAARFVDKVVDEVSGLDSMLTYYNTAKSSRLLVQKDARPVQDVDHAVMARMLDHVGHGLVTSALEQGKPARPKITRADQKQMADTMLNALFVTAQEVGHKQLPGQERVIVEQSGMGK